MPDYKDMPNEQLREEMRKTIGQPEVNRVISEVIRHQREYNATHPARYKDAEYAVTVKPANASESITTLPEDWL